MFLDEIDTLRIRQNNALSATGDLDPDLYVMLYLGDLGWTIYEAISLFCSGPSLSYAVFFMSCFSRVKTWRDESFICSMRLKKGIMTLLWGFNQVMHAEGLDYAWHKVFVQ